MSESTVRRFLFEHLDIRGAVVHLGDTWQQMQEGRNYQPTVAQLLGELAAVTALIAAQLKQPGRLTFQLRGGGPIQMTALSAVEQALWDIRGKAWGQPLYALLDRADRGLALYQCRAAAERAVRAARTGGPGTRGCCRSGPR